MPAIAFITLGCKANQYDTEGLAELFRGRGFNVVEPGGPADVLIINSCAVTARSEAKSRQYARRAKRLHPEAVVALVGCYPQVSPEGAGAVGVDILAGTADRAGLVDLVERALADRKSGRAAPLSHIGVHGPFEELAITGFAGRTRAFVKVQDGCDQFCAYCVIPLARGGVRSREAGAVLAEVEGLVERGVPEVVLTGIHLGAYGRDRPGSGLAGLVQAVAGVSGLRRLRLSSLEAIELTADLLAVMAEGAPVCPHLHLPLQSGSAGVLRRMRRPYTPAGYARRLASARRAVPGLAVSTDVIAGFPGETEAEHADSLAFVRDQGFSRLHVFPFSRRPGTPAADMPGQLQRAVREERARDFIALGRELAAAYHRTLLGTASEVLVEQVSGGNLEGMSRDYVRVICRGEAASGDTVRALIIAAEDWGVSGTLLIT
ncbi:MAG: tRNA (N(6)-L-threonylcarbamoyladenosine(37)-C(2))-methylthiotransferase MtaB [Bacillota bacterium]